MTANCSLSPNGLNSLGIPSESSTSYYSCATASNYTRLATCCRSTPHIFAEDPCYSWCDLPASLNSRFDACTDSGCDAFSYMKECLQEDRETEVEVLHCSAQPHVIYGTATTTSSEPTSTFDQSGYCATKWPPAVTDFGGVFSGRSASCAILENATNYHVLQQCCGPAPVQYSSAHCFVYCSLPRGSEFRGDGDLTTDQALGSFKACMIEYASGLSNETLFDGIYCRANDSQVYLNQSDFGTTQYLTGSAFVIAGVGTWVTLAVCLVLTFLTTYHP